jgi:hypothetical protein
MLEVVFIEKATYRLNLSIISERITFEVTRGPALVDE